MTPQLSRIADAIPEFYVLKIDKLANKLIANGQDVIKLNLGKSEVSMRKQIADEFSDAIYDKARREIIDSQGLLSLREEIAKDYNETYGVAISPANVFVNNGTSPFFLALYTLLVDARDEILFPKPYYPPYVANAHIIRAKPQFYSIHNGRINLKEFKRNFTPGKTKIIFLNSPGNPFGNILSKKEIKDILNFVNGRAYIIADEIYDGFVYRGNFTSVVSVDNPARDKVIVLNGFSKIHHMYTRRLGYAIVPNELAPSLLRFQQHNVVCVDPVTQFAGLASLKNKKKFIAKDITKEVVVQKKKLEESEKLLRKTRLKLIRPDGSFYMCVDVSSYLGRRFSGSLALAEEMLAAVGVAVTPGEDFGRNDFFRISLTGTRAVEGVRRMCQFVKGL